MQKELSFLVDRLEAVSRKLDDMKSLKNHYRILKIDNEYLMDKVQRLELDNVDMENKLNELLEQKDNELIAFNNSTDIDMRFEIDQIKLTNDDANDELKNNNQSTSRDENNDKQDENVSEDAQKHSLLVFDTTSSQKDRYTSEKIKIDVVKLDLDESYDKISDISSRSESIKNEIITKEDQQTSRRISEDITSSSPCKMAYSRNAEMNGESVYQLRSGNEKLLKERNEYKRKYEEYKAKYNRSQSKLEKKYKSMKKERNELKDIERDHDEYIHELKLNLNNSNEYISSLEYKLDELKSMSNECDEHLELIARYENDLKYLNRKLGESKTTELVLRKQARELNDRLSLVKYQGGRCENCVLLKEERAKFEGMYKKTVELLVFETTKK